MSAIRCSVTSADLVDRPRPKVCLRAHGGERGPRSSVMRFLSVFPADRFEPTYLDLFDRDDRDLRDFVCSQDLIFVGGGNTAEPARGAGGSTDSTTSCGRRGSRASCWRAERRARTAGSRRAPLTRSVRSRRCPTGSACWRAASVRTMRTSPADARCTTGLVGDGFPPGIACDDRAAVHFVGIELADVVASTGVRGRVQGLRGRRRGARGADPGPAARARLTERMLRAARRWG